MSVEAKLEILLEAVDNASATFKSAADNIRGSMGQVETAQENVATATKASEVSTTDMLLATNNLASGCTGLVNSVLSVERAQYMVEKAHLAVNRATDNLEKSQAAYNEAVSKYGEDSDQARQAADKLAIAQEALNVAQDRAGIVQNNLNQSMLSAALNVIPTLISVVTSATTIITNLTEVTDMASLAMDAIPFVAVAAGVVAVGVALYSWINSTNAAAAEEKAFNDMMEKHEATMNAQIITWEDLATSINSYTADLAALQTELEGLITEQAAAASSSAEATAYYESTHDGLTGVTRDETDYAKKIDDRIAAIRAGIQADKDQLEQLNESTKVHELYFSTVTQKTEAYQKSVSDMAATFKTDFATMTMEQVADSDVMKLDIQALADQYHVSWEQMYNDVKTSMENSQKAAEEFTNGLENKFNMQQASATSHLPAIAALWDSCYSEKRFNSCLVLAQNFADEFGITLSQAEGLISNFQAKIAEVPQTIDQKLVGEAQAKFEAFKNCVSGKALTLSTDVTGAMADMGAQVTELINKGFVGEAQNEMASYVNCSTSKVADMTVQINKYMDDLTTSHNAKLASLTAMAAAAYGAEKDTILGILDQENAGYQVKMEQLRAWQEQLCVQLLNQARKVQAEIVSITQSQAQAMTAEAGLNTEGLYPGQLHPLAEGSNYSSSISSYWQDQEAISRGYTSYQAYLAWSAQQGLVPQFAEGAIVREPTLALIGEKGPEAVVPIGEMRGETQIVLNVNITDSLIDRPMVDLIRKEVGHLLESVLVETTSSGAQATKKRIVL